MTGGNDALRPEESESTSFGLILTPTILPGFRLSADYSLIKKTDEISGISRDELLSLESQFPDRVVRAELTDEDIALGFTGGAIEVLDLSLFNLAKSRIEAWDFQVNQLFETQKYGNFDFYAVATLQTALEAQILDGGETIDRVGFRDGPLEWRLNGGLNWDSPNRDLSVGWNFQYYDDYLVYRSTDFDSQIERTVGRQGSDTIGSEVYHDLSVVYRFGDAAGYSGLLDNVEIRAAIQNVFDDEPATIAANGYFSARGSYSPYGDIRLRRYSIAVRKTF